MKKIGNLEVMLAEVGGNSMDLGMKYTRAITKFENVVTLCFGTSPQPGYEEAIQDFKEAYMDLGITVTPKLLFSYMLRIFEIIS